jgi:hypothetical protein
VKQARKARLSLTLRLPSIPAFEREESSGDDSVTPPNVTPYRISLGPIPHLSARPSSPAARQDSLIQQSAVCVRRATHFSAPKLARCATEQPHSAVSCVCAESHTFQRAQARPLRDRTALLNSQLCAERQGDSREKAAAQAGRRVRERGNKSRTIKEIKIECRSRRSWSQLRRSRWSATCAIRQAWR